MRSVVVLPQPEGPSRVTNSPCSTARSMASTAFTSPNWRPTVCRMTLGTVRLLVDLLGEAEHGVLPLRHGSAHCLGCQQWPYVLGRPLDHAADHRIVSGIGVDELLLGLEVEVHEQPRGVGVRGVLERGKLEADIGPA